MTRAHESGEGRGWIEFVGLFFIVAGAFNAIAGIAALSRPEVFHEDAALVQHMSFWAWVVVGFLLDVMSYGSGARGQQQRSTTA